jgi:hypothetical protein
MEKKEYQKKVVVRAQIPQREVREVTVEEEQTKYEIISIEEALTEILSFIRNQK